MKTAGFFIFWIFIFLPLASFACPVCFSAKGGTLNAFRWSTLLLSLIPMVAIASFIFWIRFKTKNKDS